MDNDQVASRTPLEEQWTTTLCSAKGHDTVPSNICQLLPVTSCMLKNRWNMRIEHFRPSATTQEANAGRRSKNYGTRDFRRDGDKYTHTNQMSMDPPDSRVDGYVLRRDVLAPQDEPDYPSGWFDETGNDEIPIAAILN